MKKIGGLMMALTLIIGLSVQAEATLIVRGTDTAGNQLIYDTDRDITWYDYTNDANTWQNQVNWANALSVTFGSTIYDDWRLPITPQPDLSCSGQSGVGSWGNNCTGSEMGHLYYTELGNAAGGPPSWDFIDGSTGNPESFDNLRANFYWSGTEYAPDPGWAWSFLFDQGYQGIADKDYALGTYGLAVRYGDVSAAVPEPATLLLLGSGLAGMAVLRKKMVRKEG